MGRRIRVQRRGRGGSVFRAHVIKRAAPSVYPPLRSDELRSAISGRVIDLLHDPGRGAPLALIEYADGSACCIAAPEGLSVDQMVFRGTASNIDIGYVLPLGHIPEGTLVCNVEATPGDGGKIAKSSGAYAIVVSHTSIGSELRFPSGKTKYLDDRCRATIGVIAGSGRIEKPFVKAGVKRALMLSKGRVWPVVKGQAMIAASHPYGGGRHKHAGKPTTVGRHTPPGRKVGLIAARQSGRAKRRAR